MERQHNYKPSIQASPGNLREGHVISPPQTAGAGQEILQAALSLGGGFMNVYAKDYQRQMRGRMDDSILAVNAEFERWKTGYKAKNQGVLAQNAQQDFADKYMELARQAMQDFDGRDNEVYAGELEREFAKNGLYAIKEGGAYQLAQDEAWQKSQWEAQLSAFQKVIDENPDDPEMLQMEAGTLLKSHMEKNPGLDPGLVRDRLQSMLANGRIQALIARGDYAAAERLLGDDSKPLSKAEHSGSGSHTIAEDFHNPLNLKKVGANSGGREDFRKFESDADGFRGAHQQLKLYYNRDGLKTPRKMISKWAPASENNLGDYFRTIAGQGIDIDKAIDMNDPKEAARLVRAMAMHEGPLGKRYSPEQVESFLRGQMQAVQSDFGIAGLTQVERLRYQRQIAAMRESQEKEAKSMFIAQTAQEIAEQIRQLPQAAREHAMNSQLEKIPDQQMRSEIMKIAREDIRQYAEAEKARDGARAYLLMEEGRMGGDTVSAFMHRLNGSGLGEEAKKLAMEGFQGKLEDNEASQTALQRLLARIDHGERKGSPLTTDDIYAYALDNRLTNAQTKTALSYLEAGGNLHGLKLSALRETYISLQAGIGGQVEIRDVPDWLFQAALEEFKESKYEGKKIDDRTLREIVSSLLIKGTVPGFWWSSTKTYGEALAKGEKEEWTPLISKGEALAKGEIKKREALETSKSQEDDDAAY